MQLKNFLKSRGPLLALLIIILYGFLIFLIYFTGYQPMPSKLDQLPVTVVNEDKQSQKLQKQITKSLPFKTIKTTTNLKSAKRDLNRRSTYLLINIPKGFAQRVRTNKTADLNFYVNESVQTSASSGMKQVAKTLGADLNQQISLKKGQAILTQTQLAVLKQQLGQQKNKLNQEMAMQKEQIQQAPTAEQAELSSQLQEKSQAADQKMNQTATKQKTTIRQRITQTYKSVGNSVHVRIHQVNKVKTGLNYSLAPFFANIAIYLSSLFGAMLLYGTYAKFVPKVGRFKAFAMLELTMFLLATVGTAIVSGGFIALMGVKNISFGTMWLNHGLTLLGAYNLNAILILLMGQMGTALNVFLTMIQVVASAGMIPVTVMTGFFKFAHVLSPMFYGTMADFNIMYGGVGTTGFLTQQMILILCLILINTLIIAFRKKQPMLQFNQLS